MWQLYLVQGLIFGAGTAGPFVCIVSTVAKWHTKRRGLALGMASAGMGLSMVLSPPLAASLNAAVGWRQACVVLGLVALVITIPTSLFVKDPPSTGNQNAGAANGGEEGKNHGGSTGPFGVMRSLPHLLQNRQFLSLFLFFLLFYIGCQLLSNHLVNYFTDAGISTLAAATMMSAVGIASIAGRLAMGPVSDKFGTKVDATVCCSLVIAALVLLTFKEEPLMWLSAALFGVGSGGAAPLIPAIMGEHFGTKNLATMTGAILIADNLGSALGPWMGGYVFDITNSYLWALILSAILLSLGLAIALRLGSPTGEVR
ncbi:MAG: MFS transporter [Dehalococcoidia bacterium]|nr:MFS transporter [Dehalococcoidia bacterium]